MKKILFLMVLCMVALNSAFGCESIFDSVKGMTCEIECILCGGCNIDIKLCDEVKERYEQFKEEYAIVNEKWSKALEMETEALEKELDINDENYEINSYERKKLIAEAQKLRREADKTPSVVRNNFLGKENLMLLQNADFVNEVYKVLGE